MSILVTGGSGFLGRRLKKHQPDWTYLSSKDCDLTNSKACMELISDLKPEAIVHLAGRVGGIKDNIKNQGVFFFENTMINTNVIHSAYKSGVKRVLSSLSTCVFPDRLPCYPFEEEQLFDGPPTKTNFSYGMAKRSLHVQSCAYRNQYNLNYSTFCPSNLYGPEDHFGKENSHYVASLIHKVAIAKSGDTIDLWGTGIPLRQQLYVDDLCKIIPDLLEKHNTSIPLIVAPNENLSILDMARILVKKSDKNVIISFDGKVDGQFRKDGDNEKFLKLMGGFQFTPFEKGVFATYKWYLNNGAL
jgi:GDP-L-fucose synthase